MEAVEVDEVGAAQAADDWEPTPVRRKSAEQGAEQTGAEFISASMDSGYEEFCIFTLTQEVGKLPGLFFYLHQQFLELQELCFPDSALTQTFVFTYSPSSLTISARMEGVDFAFLFSSTEDTVRRQL